MTTPAKTEEIKTEPVSTKKAPVKRAAAKKAAASTAAVKKAEAKETVYIQFAGAEYNLDEIRANVKKAWMDEQEKRKRYQRRTDLCKTGRTCSLLCSKSGSCRRRKKNQSVRMQAKKVGYTNCSISYSGQPHKKYPSWNKNSLMDIFKWFLQFSEKSIPAHTLNDRYTAYSFFYKSFSSFYQIVYPISLGYNKSF